MNTISEVRGMQLPFEEHQERQRIYRKSSSQLLSSLREIKEGELPTYDAADFPLLKFAEENSKWEIPLASDSRWANKPFGAVNSLEKAGCLVFCVCNMLHLLGEKAEVLQVAKVAVEKGFRFWKFQNDPRSFNWDKVTLSKIKEHFPDFSNVDNLEEALKILGKPLGIGGHCYFIDEVISLITGNIPYQETKIYSWQQIVDNLQNGYPVPIRINRGLLMGQKPSEGHYVNLIGMRDQNVVIVDSSAPEGIIEVQIDRFILAAIHDGNRVTAWCSMPSKH